MIIYVIIYNIILYIYLSSSLSIILFAMISTNNFIKENGMVKKYLFVKQ